MRWLILAQVLLAFGIIYILFHTETRPLDQTDFRAAVFDFHSNGNDGTQTPGGDSKKDDIEEPQDPSDDEEVPEMNPDGHPAVPEGVQIRYKTKKTRAPEYYCPQKDRRRIMLCELGIGEHCRTKYISEVISSFWMVCPIYTANVQQTKRLYNLHRNFKSYANSLGINLQTVEVIFPGQSFQLTKPNNQPEDLQYTDDWIFAMRENLVNVGVKHLPPDWEYVAWIDQHVFWVDPYWFERTIWLFNHYNAVHLLNGNEFMDAKNVTEDYLNGFGRIYNTPGVDFEKVEPRQCGMAWGTRREIFEQLGGLFDLCIGTKCDLYMNYAYVGRKFTRQAPTQDYVQMLDQWQEHAIKVFDKKLGFLDTRMLHWIHCTEGCYTSNYNLQIQAMYMHHYNPKNDLVRDFEGRLSLKNNIKLAKKMWQLYGGSPR